MASQEQAFQEMRDIMFGYAPLSPATWNKFITHCRLTQFAKQARIVNLGEVPEAIYFIVEGLVRAYSIGGKDQAKEANKVFFAEGRFAGSIVALLRQEPSYLCLECLEPTTAIVIPYEKYRAVLRDHVDFKDYHIAYLERHWVIEKEPVEISVLIDDAAERYRQFLDRYGSIAERIPLYHIAAKIGVTPTQLSRIRRKISE